MPVNNNKPHLWKQDVALSVEQYNSWFLNFAPLEYRNKRIETTAKVQQALLHTTDFLHLTPAILETDPGVLPVLRMATAPPLARDRLIGLSGVDPNLVKSMEEGNLPPQMALSKVAMQLQSICDTLNEVLDRDISVWLDAKRQATQDERLQASMIVADRLCGALTNPIVRNVQEKRQLQMIENYLIGLGYIKKSPSPGQPLAGMQPGTFCFWLNVPADRGDDTTVNITVDAVVQPKQVAPGELPLLIEAKSAGDFTNTNKRRKEEAQKHTQLIRTYGPDVRFILFLCGYFGPPYLGYEAAEGIDWVWEHRISDLSFFGL
ncbi:MAG TPA: XamI family restriction endonuclease [Abditibacterium sp.]|jgi:hypothetical protein